MRRHHLLLGLLALLTVSSGCIGAFTGGTIDEATLTENVDSVTYDWETDAAASIDVRKDEYRSVYEVGPETVGEDGFEVYTRNGFGQERPLSIETLKFRYTNGTVITVAEGPGHERFFVNESRERATITYPDEEGQVAFVVPKNGKSVTTPVYLEHTRTEGPSYEVRLPANTDVAIPLLSNVQPGGYTTTQTADESVRIRWDQVTTDAISVRYYLDRDLLIFGSLFAVLAIVGGAGVAYYALQLRELERRREDVALDLEGGEK